MCWTRKFWSGRSCARSASADRRALSGGCRVSRRRRYNRDLVRIGPEMTTSSWSRPWFGTVLLLRLWNNVRSEKSSVNQNVFLCWWYSLVFNYVLAARKPKPILRSVRPGKKLNGLKKKKLKVSFFLLLIVPLSDLRNVTLEGFCRQKSD